MLAFPNAKINLGLNIIEKRKDGFHTIETVFYPVQWSDVLEVIPGKTESRSKINFTTSGLPVPSADSNNKNLCIRAYELLDEHFQLPPVEMHLHKIIPAGAGLGGGSSDAAFTLKLINDCFDLKLNRDQLQKFALQLGSDCSFFLENKPMAAKGRGEILFPVQLSLKNYYIVIAKPPLHISTAEAYATAEPQASVKSPEDIVKLPVTLWKNLLKNDFEKTIFPKYPLLAELKTLIYRQGALYASMSGSGSAVYGIFEKQISDLKVFKNCVVWQSEL